MTQLSRALNPLRGGEVDIVSYEGLGNDVPVVSQQLADALRSAGLRATIFTPRSGSGVVRGVAVRTEVGSPMQGVNLIAQSLNAVGLVAAPVPAYPVGEAIAGGFMGPDGIAPTAKIRILVGAKPT